MASAEPPYFRAIEEKLRHAISEQCRSLDWYIYTVETVAMRTRLAIDGDWSTRRWWFVLMEIPYARKPDAHLEAVDS